MIPMGFVLIGMPGSGKSEIGRRAADRLEKPFIDLDKEIALKTGRSPGDIISEEGEPAFRKIETEMLLTYEGNDILLSTGGGIVTIPENQKLLQKIGKIIWIRRDIETIANAVSYSNDRPLLKNRTSLDELWASRKDLYASWADAIFENSGNMTESSARLVTFLQSLIDPNDSTD